MAKDQGVIRVGEDAPLEHMYQKYFLDYASYVILERAVPTIEDGLKPVQRRIMYSMRRMHDGRYHKVANIIGQTMQFHPHGDAAIGDALVNLGQKDLLVDTQGNWGDFRTGDSAAAPRYIEARLTPFALDVLFNNDTTEWQASYDGRNKEPVTLPAKFPLVLALGVEGIAVGLSTKILPHNFIEIIQAAIKHLQGKSFKIYPDFQTGGQIDISEYNKGQRGGKVKVRAKIEKRSKNELAITQVPYGTTTTQLIDSILKANDKGKIKIKSVVDNTAEHVELLIELVAGQSPDMAIDALYAFTNCELSVSTNACVIDDNKPEFLTVNDILISSTDQTLELLKWELELKQKELEEKWHFSSLEKIFIEQRIYRDIEECESWDEVLEAVHKALLVYVQTPINKKPKKQLATMLRDISDEDIVRLTEIKIKRISKYNNFKADKYLKGLEDELKEVKHHLAHIVDFTIAFFEMLLEKYGKDKKRRTEIKTFGQIEAKSVVANNVKLYYNKEEGFVGTGLKKDEFLAECSDIDDVIVIRKDGKCVVTRVADKTFVGKGILFAGVWKKGDDRMTYNLLHVDGKSGTCYAKRFQLPAATRNKEYNLSTPDPKSKIIHLTSNSNGEAEVVEVKLHPRSKARNKKIEFDFSELAIKGRGARGNTLTKYPIKSVKIIQEGTTTLGGIKYWLNKKTNRLVTEESDLFLGAFNPGDMCLALYKDGSYELIKPDANRRFDMENMLVIERFSESTIISAIHYDGQKKWSMVKRFQIETLSEDQRFSFISETPGSKLLFVSTAKTPRLQYSYREKGRRISDVVNLKRFIEVKGWKALGNKLFGGKVTIGKEITTPDNDDKTMLSAGDTIDFDVEEDGQGSLF